MKVYAGVVTKQDTESPHPRRAPGQVASASTWRWLALLLVVALLAGFARREALDVGLLADDYMQHAMLTGSYPGEDYVPLDLYAFLRSDPQLQARHIEHGTAPWWSVVEGDPDAAGGTVVFAVLRPLSSALLTLDHELWPLDRAGATRARHLHSLLWFVLTIVAAGLVLGQLFERRIAMLAIVLFACDAGLVVPLAWLANRCVLISASFGLLGVWAHLRWRAGANVAGVGLGTRTRRSMIALECVCMIAAMAAGEYGLLAVSYVLAWELVGVESGSVATRVRAVLPALVPALIYLVMHQVLGYGTFGEAYADMFGAPSKWLALASERAAKLATSAAWGLPPTTGDAFDTGMRWLSKGRLHADIEREHLLWCAMLLPLMAALVGVIRVGLSPPERRALAALVLGAVLGLAPITAPPPQERLLVLSQLGACALIAAVIVASVRLLRGRMPDTAAVPSWLRRLMPAPFVLLLLYSHIVFDLRSGQRMLGTIHAGQAPTLAAFARGDLPSMDPEALRGREVIVLNAVNLPTGLHGGFMLEAHGWPAPRSWRALAMGPFALSVTRPAPDTLELWAVQGAWLATTYEHNFRRADQPLVAGDVRERGGLRVEIIEDLDGHPTRVRVRFPVSVDDPRYLFLMSTKQGLRRWQPPELRPGRARALGGGEAQGQPGRPGIVPLPALPVVPAGQRVAIPGP